MFVPGADGARPIPLPKAEVDKLRRVLRLEQGAHLAVLPGDGTLIRCELRGPEAIPLEVASPETESPRHVTIAQALPKGDRLDSIVRCCTEIGVAAFVLFPSDRSVVKWDEAKLAGRLERFRTVAREAAEQSFRTRVPTIEYASSLSEVLARHPDATVLSEVEGTVSPLRAEGEDARVVVVGPEGGWAPRELEQIGGRGVTLGPRVLRVDTAAIAAAALLLLAPETD
ncbi:MAG: 16S rRNA (uracil(1498)-N(3))-methyltransferase [Fimbriimonadaceae bacterium]|nr:16S rRNA (uracil(1498)-N(3))-methyltransferase [Fimbriimonadaceae bacterium]